MSEGQIKLAMQINRGALAVSAQPPLSHHPKDPFPFLSTMDHVPPEVVLNVLFYLDGRSLTQMSRTSLLMRSLADDKNLWESVLKRELPGIANPYGRKRASGDARTLYAEHMQKQLKDKKR